MCYEYDSWEEVMTNGENFQFLISNWKSGVRNTFFFFVMEVVICGHDFYLFLNKDIY